IRDFHVTGVQTCALPISCGRTGGRPPRSLRDRLSGRPRGAGLSICTWGHLHMLRRYRPPISYSRWVIWPSEATWAASMSAPKVLGRKSVVEGKRGGQGGG